MELKIVGRQIETPLKPIGSAGEYLELAFLIPRYDGEKDLVSGTAYLMITQNGTTQTHYMSKEVGDSAIRAVWNGSFSSAGTVSVAIKVSDMAAELWRSRSTTLKVNEAEMPQMRAFGMLRMAVPEEEDPITVSERKIIVPEGLKNIAVQNDENSETVKIVVPRYFDGNDLDQYTAILKTISEGGKDDLYLEKLSTDDSEIVFSWTLAPPQTSYAGSLELQIRFVGSDFKWETESTSVNIIESGDADPIIPNAPSTPENVDQSVQEGSVNAVSGGAVKEYVDSVLGDVQASLETILNGG